MSQQKADDSRDFIRVRLGEWKKPVTVVAVGDNGFKFERRLQAKEVKGPGIYRFSIDHPDARAAHSRPQRWYVGHAQSISERWRKYEAAAEDPTKATDTDRRVAEALTEAATKPYQVAAEVLTSCEIWAADTRIQFVGDVFGENHEAADELLYITNRFGDEAARLLVESAVVFQMTEAAETSGWRINRLSSGRDNASDESVLEIWEA